MTVSTVLRHGRSFGVAGRDQGWACGWLDATTRKFKLFCCVAVEDISRKDLIRLANGLIVAGVQRDDGRVDVSQQDVKNSKAGSTEHRIVA